MAKKGYIKSKNTIKTTASNIVEKVIEKITPTKKEVVEEIVKEEVVLDTHDVKVLKFLAESKSDIFIKINEVLEQTGLSLGEIKVLLSDLKGKGFINIPPNYAQLGNVGQFDSQNLSNLVIKAIITDKGLEFLGN